MKKYWVLGRLLFASPVFFVSAEESTKISVPDRNDTSEIHVGSGLMFTPKPQFDRFTSTMSGLIKSFDVFIPISVELCPTNNPWLLGKRILKNNTILTSQDCFSLHLVANEKINIYFFSQSTNGKSFKLFPNTCIALGDVSSQLEANESIDLPKFNKQHVGAIGLDNERGTEWLHAVAIRSRAAKMELEDLIREIPDVCDTSINVKYSADLLQRVFILIGKNYPDEFDWQSIKFIHQ